MGMFDYFEFKAVSHPNFKYKHYCLDFQTKSLDNLMETYLLRGERLFIKDYDDVCSLTGGYHIIYNRSFFTGEVQAYDIVQDKRITYIMEFNKGCLIDLKLEENRD